MTRKENQMKEGLHEIKLTIQEIDLLLEKIPTEVLKSALVDMRNELELKLHNLKKAVLEAGMEPMWAMYLGDDRYAGIYEDFDEALSSGLFKYAEEFLGGSCDFIRPATDNAAYVDGYRVCLVGVKKF